MKNLANIFVIIFFSITVVSCQTKKGMAALKSASRFYTDSIYSESLGEYRRHNIYLPQGFSEKNKYPIIYATDGVEISEKSFYKSTLDSLISQHIIKPVILIMSHSNDKVIDDLDFKMDGQKISLNIRNYEYVEMYPDVIKFPFLKNIFQNHMRYFKDELIPKVEIKLNQKLGKNDRYFYGVSNGAGFGLSLLNLYPNTIGTYLCFSTFGGNIQSNDWKEGVSYPKLYLQYGSEEPLFLKEDADFLIAKYKQLNLAIEVKEFEGGHENGKWNEKFLETICKLFHY